MLSFASMTSPGADQIHYRNCSICEAICGIEITQNTDGTLDIRGDKEDPFSRGYICPKAVALQDLHLDKDRLKYPVRRTPHGWQRLRGDGAFDEGTQKLKRIHPRDRKNSIPNQPGNPHRHNHGAPPFAP